MSAFLSNIKSVAILIASTCLTIPASVRAETLLYSFQGGNDGSGPVGNLTNVGGIFYGTTSSGGGTQNSNCPNGCGTVFTLTPAGVEKVLYSFKGGSDGWYPWAGLVNVAGTLYGTTVDGGSIGTSCSSGCGTVFKITPSGEFSTIYAFQGGADGANPNSTLLNVSGVLYGTTYAGGSTCGLFATGCGTIFKITPAGAEQVLHVFLGSPDGLNPGQFIEFDAAFYGVTQGGPVGFGTQPQISNGSVFRLTKAGQLKTLHVFGSGTDGIGPSSPLVELNGLLYGTTGGGGTVTSCSGGCGTAYSITRQGTESVIYNFPGGAGLRSPTSGLVTSAGILFGTTLVGGKYADGTVFKLTPSGVATDLHDFGNKQDGIEPNALLRYGNAYYGTTIKGGSSGFGTVFQQVR